MRKYLESAGFTVQVAVTPAEAVGQLRADPLELAFASASFESETLCKQLKELVPSLPVVLLYPPDADDAEAQSAQAGADGALVGPLKRGTVVSCAKLVLQMRVLRETVDRLESNLQKHIAEPPKDVVEVQGTSADFEFFKKYLLMEVKRSRRYKYPVAFLLVAIDHFAERSAALSQELPTSLLAQALAIVTRGVRDIDLAVPSGENRFLVLLPNTPRPGALFVATRLRERLSRLDGLGGDVTASVGVAAYEPGVTEGQISFGSLMKDVTEALSRAQAAGGNRVDGGEPTKKRDRISLA
ncbi:MAG: diguanylate cyclase [Myxococcaceae bacterium]